MDHSNWRASFVRLNISTRSYRSDTYASTISIKGMGHAVLSVYNNVLRKWSRRVVRRGGHDRISARRVKDGDDDDDDVAARTALIRVRVLHPRDFT